MNVKSEVARLRARNLRYRKAIVKDANIETIQEELNEIYEECDNVRYYFEGDDDTLLNALDGDEDEAYEFKMMFSDLSYECERMMEDLHYGYVPEYFDNFFVAASSNEALMGWDAFEGDYFGLGDSFEENLARKEARKRMERMTKNEIMEAAQVCFRVFRAYMGIRHRYDCLKAAMDILRDENTGYLKMVKSIEEAYERAAADDFRYSKAAREFEELTKALPDMAWIQ